MISIIIPTLNEEKIIEKTLKFLKEFKGDCEIIISDGKSTDKTIEIAKMYGVKTIIYNDTKRQTIAGGRNLGASIAQGEFLVFLDADVTINDVNNFFTKCLDFFKKDTALVGLNVCIKVLPEYETLADRIIFSMVNYVFFFLNNVLHFGGAGGEFQMIKNETFKKVSGYNETLPAGEDNDMFQRLSKEGKTKTALSLKVMHTGRRGHQVGWPKLLSTWMINYFSVLFFGRSFNSIWEEIR